MARGFPYRITTAAWRLLVVATTLVGCYGLSVLLGDDWVRERQTTAVLFADYPVLDNAVLIGHIVTALPPLVIGVWEFSPSQRKRHIVLHRELGKIYCICIFLSSILGFALATRNGYGPVAQGGFGTLAVGWFATTLFALTTVQRGDLPGHRRWMIRSYALTLAVVTVRFLSQPPEGMTKLEWYPIMTWVCWVPNAIAGELYVRLTDYKGRFCMPAPLRRLLHVRSKASALST